MSSIDSIRLSEKQKQQLIMLKRKTGIENWNVLCRWAICMSLAEETSPPREDVPSDSNVEMTWKTFAGEHAELYTAILQTAFHDQRKDFDEITFYDFIKLHLNRGISFFLRST